MTKVYTIQNEHGDKCFIQYFENGREYDEIIGWGGSCEHNPEYNYLHCVISEEEYKSLKCIHDFVNEHGYEELYDALNLMLEATLKKNRHKILTNGDIYEGAV
jgi:hypothetical protein